MTPAKSSFCHRFVFLPLLLQVANIHFIIIIKFLYLKLVGDQFTSIHNYFHWIPKWALFSTTYRLKMFNFKSQMNHFQFTIFPPAAEQCQWMVQPTKPNWRDRRWGWGYFWRYKLLLLNADSSWNNLHICMKLTKTYLYICMMLTTTCTFAWSWHDAFYQPSTSTSMSTSYSAHWQCSYFY